MHYVSTAERQIIKLSHKHISNYNLSIMTIAENQLRKVILLLHKVLSTWNK